MDEGTRREDNTKILSLPYVKGLSESIKRSCKHFNIKFAFKSRRTLLTRVKNTIPKEKKGVVYKVNCSCGNTYIGETGRTLYVRLNEHRRAVKMNNKSNGITVHANSTSPEVIETKN